MYTTINGPGWDCHTHVFGPYDRYPLAPERTYSPPTAAIDDLQAHLDLVGLSRVVLVQPNSYDTDTRAMDAALAALGDRARGVTVIDPSSATVTDLDRMRDSGIRGVRFNVHTAGTPESSTAQSDLDRTVRLLLDSGLHLQIFATGALLAELVSRIGVIAKGAGGSDDGLQVVVDHMGMALHRNGDGEPIARLLADAGCWIKLSAPERMGLDPFDLRVRHLVDVYADCAPDRILWGSDWPHSQLAHTLPLAETEPFRNVDDQQRLLTLRGWLGEELYRRMLCANPEALYG